MCNLGQLPVESYLWTTTGLGFFFFLSSWKRKENAGTPSLENQMWHPEADFPLVNKFQDEAELNKAAN